MNVLSAIIISLLVIGTMGIVAYFLYKSLSKTETKKCFFVMYTPLSPGESPPPNTKIQCGYITCNSYNTSLTVTNNGPGEFYLGPINGEKELHTLSENSSVTFSVTSTAVNVYYDSSSEIITPNFTITNLK